MGIVNLGPPLSVRRIFLAIFLVALYLAPVSYVVYISKQKDDLQMEYSRLCSVCNEPAPTRPIGLVNFGMVCYMNSVLQCFASIYNELSLESYQLRTEAMKAFRKTLRIIQQRDKITESAYRADELFEELKKIKVIDAEAGEADADEFLNNLVNRLPSGSAIWEQTFGYELQDCNSCIKNSHPACTSNSNLALPINVPVQTGSVLLESLLLKFSEAGNVETRCSQCDSTQSSKTMTVTRTNPVLIILLKRYGNYAYADVKIPDDLFINGKYYTLKGAVMHAGNTDPAAVQSVQVLAHYVAIVRYGNDNFVCNDSEITALNGSINDYDGTYREKPFKPYVLFYTLVESS